jgi:excisionase family DNA binding protein
MPAIRRSSPTPGPRSLDPPRHYVSTETAAEILDVSKKTVRRWIDTGRLPAYRVGPRYIRIDLAELEAAMVRRIPTASPGGPDAS